MSMSCINQLKKLTAKLFGKQNTWCYNNKCLTVVDKFHVSHGIFDHTNGLATTSRDDDLTFVVVPHSIDCFLLMGTQGDGQVLSCSVWIYYSRKPPPVRLGGRFLNCLIVSSSTLTKVVYRDSINLSSLLCYSLLWNQRKM